ncbi:hypothetical protein [Streptomyces sp. NPDC046979]|uniref:hypothetical protein n=1 Tax=Streptomyces sp. NPDC046979 TaxID=3154604 RepID=UPI0033E78D5F
MNPTSLYERSKTAFLAVMNLLWATISVGLASGWGASMAGKEWTDAVGVAFTASTAVGMLLTAVASLIYVIRQHRP